MIKIETNATQQEIWVEEFNARQSFSLKNEIVDFGDAFDYQLINQEVDQWEAATYRFNGVTINYRLFKPKNISGKVPLVLALHGSGETAARTNNDNRSHLSSNRLGLSFSDDHWQADNPCFVLMPQFPSIDESYSYEKYWEVYKNLCETLIQLYPIDERRLYLATLSMGSRQGYRFLEQSPDFFSAAMINCGNPTETNLSVIENIPMKLFHIEQDKSIPTECSKKVLNYMLEANPENFSLEIFPYEFVQEKKLTNAHSIWEYTMELDSLKQWLFSFKKKEASLNKLDNHKVVIVSVSGEKINDFIINNGDLYLEKNIDNQLIDQVNLDRSEYIVDSKKYLKYDTFSLYLNQNVLVEIS